MLSRNVPSSSMGGSGTRPSWCEPGSFLKVAFADASWNKPSRSEAKAPPPRSAGSRARSRSPRRRPSGMQCASPPRSEPSIALRERLDAPTTVVVTVSLSHQGSLSDITGILPHFRSGLPSLHTGYRSSTRPQSRAQDVQRVRTHRRVSRISLDLVQSAHVDPLIVNPADQLDTGEKGQSTSHVRHTTHFRSARRRGESGRHVPARWVAHPFLRMIPLTLHRVSPS